MRIRTLGFLLVVCVAAVPWTRSAADDDWQTLVELVESLPEDLDAEMRQLIADLLAETGGFASTSDSLPANKLEVAPEPSIGFSALSRCEGVLRGAGSGGAIGATGGGGAAGEGGDSPGGWSSFDPRTYLRLRGELPGHVTLGAAVERDPGETDALDYVAGYLRWDGGQSVDGDPVRRRITLVAGDIVVEWGQRLLAGSPSFGTPGGPELRDRLRGYDGAAESAGRFGVAASGGAGSYELSVLVARTLLDAGLDDDGRVTAVRTSGTHVTEGERQGKDALRESAVGVRFTRTTGAPSAGAAGAAASADPGPVWRVGASFVGIRYDRSIIRSDPERAQFGFEGDVLELCGVDLAGRTRRLRWGAEFVLDARGEGAALISIEARPGRARVLLGADIASRGFVSPLGSPPPGASSGGNCVSSWYRLSYGARGGWSAWCRGQLTGHLWRTYNEPLPPHASTFAVGGRVRLGRGVLLTAERSVRSESGTSAVPYTSETTSDRRERLGLSVGGEMQWKLWVARTSRTRGSVWSGLRTGAGCALTAAPGTSGDRLSIGVTLVAAEGSAPTLYAGEPGLPGAFGLRSLKGSGAGWYIRARKALPAGTFVTARVSRSASGEELTLGLAIEAGTASRR